MTGARGTAVITGASSGIGAASARRLAAEGFDVVLGARRIERIRALAGELGAVARAIALDVTQPASVDRFCDELGADCRLLVNCAGGAFGAEPIAQADDEHWNAMWDTNVMGLMRMTRALLPLLPASGDGRARPKSASFT